MKKITMLFLFLLSALLSYGQEVTIGTGTLTQRWPFGATWGYERSAALYTATEIGQTGFINELAWNLSSSTASARAVKIYLKETTSTTLTAATWSTFITGATLVYDGMLDPTTTGFNSLISFVSFPYTGGTNNLMVLVETNYGGSGGGGSYSVMGTAASGMHFMAYADGSAPTGNLSEASGSTRPNLKITFGAEIECPMALPTILRTTATELTFNVTERATTQSIYYEVRTEGAAGSGATGLVTSNTVTDLTTLPVEVSNLTPNTNYSLYVRAICAEDETSLFSNALNFTTSEEGVIGGGSRQDSYLPLYSLNAYNWSQMIYTAEEVGNVLEDRGLVERIKLYYTGTGSVANYNTWTVYLTNTTKAEFTGTAASDWIPHAEFTQVFQGTVTLVANEWTEIIFDSPFVWDGESNLAVAVYEDAPSWSSGSRFATFATDTYRGILRSSDTFYTPDGGAGSTYGRYQYLPKLYIDGIAPPSCYLPINGRVANLTATSVEIEWGILNNGESIGVDYYISTTDTAPTATTTASGTMADEEARSLTIEDLEENTTYYVWLRNTCEDNTKTDWIARPIVVNTPLVPAALPYSEDFEGEVNMAYIQNTTNKWFVGNAVNNGGERALYISHDNGVTNAYEYSGAQASHAYKDFEIPANTNELSIRFDWRCVGETTVWDSFRVWMVPVTYIPAARVEITAGSNRTRLGRENYNGNSVFLTENLIVDASAFAGQTMRLVFEWHQDGSGGNQPPAAIDNLNIDVITCSQPGNFEVEDVTSTSIDVSWSEVGSAASYDVYISTSDTAPTDTATVVNTTETEHSFEDLDSNTYYYIWVRSRCTATDLSLWTGPLHVSTGLVPVDIPYTDTFETAQEYAFRNHSVNKWHIGTAVNNGGTSALYISNNDGVANEYTNSVTQTSHVYKDFTIPADAEELEVQFDWRSVGDNSDGFTVWAVPVAFEPRAGTEITTAATRVRLGRTLYGQNSNFVTERLVMDASAFAGQTMRLVFSWKNNSWDGENPPAAIDNLKLNYSTCIQPTSSQATAVTAESIAVSWSAVEGVTDYELKITTTPTAPAETVAGVTVTGTTHTFENLDSNTTYYIWVRSICSTTNKSFWKGPLQVTTDLVSVDLPYRDGFEGDQQYAMRNDGVNQWYIGNAVNYGGQKSLYISNNGGVDNLYTYSGVPRQYSQVYKDFNVPTTGANNLGINFDWRSVGESTWDAFKVWLVPTTYRPTAGVETTTTNSGGVLIGRSVYSLNSIFLNERLVVDASAFAGQRMRLLFEWKNDTGGGAQPPAAIDNLEVHIITCSEPTNVQIDSVTSTSATISWTPVEGQTNYEVYHSATNPGLLGDTVTGSVTTTENPYTIEGLDDNTEYFIWVRTICSATNKSSWVRVIGWTGQIPGELTYEDNFEGDNNWSFISNADNKWVVGRAVSNGGVNALYITKDNGLTNTYNGGVTTVAHAYRDLAVPAEAIGGSLTFDWRALGEGSVNFPTDYMRVWLVPASFRPVMGQQIMAATGRLQIGGLYFQQEEFTTALESVDLAPFAGQTMRLVFEWINNNFSASDPPAAVDNVIFKVETCPAVTGLSACGGADRINYGWDSQEGMTRWEIAFSTTDGAEPDPDLIEIVEEPNYSARGLTLNTTYYFYVRNVCGPDDVSMWKKINVRTNSTSILDAEPFCAGPGGIIFPNNHRGNTPEQYPLGEGRIACLSSAPYPVWYFLKIDQDGDLVFDIIQNTAFDANGNQTGTGLDVDFVAFGPFDTLDQACAESVLGPCPPGVNCPNNTSNQLAYPAGNIVDCSFSGRAVESLTINNAVRGQIYAVLITNWNGGEGFIKLAQRNVEEAGAGTTDCKFLCEVDLGPDQYLCPGTNSFEIKANISAAGSTEDMEYTWFKDGEMMDPAVFNTNRLTVTETGTYRVRVEKDLCEENPEDEVYIKFYDEIELRLPEKLELCDVDNVGYADFEVKRIVEEALAAHAEPETLVHAYYPTYADAQAKTNPITVEDLYRSPGDSEIFIAVSRDMNPKCVSIFRLGLNIKATVYFNADFAYEAPICMNNIDELPIIPGPEFTLGGEFSYKTISHTNPKDPLKEAVGGLVLNRETGTINVGASTAGVYEVNYFSGVPEGMCGESVSHTVTITIFERFEIVFDGDCYNGKYYLRVNDVLENIDMDQASFVWSGPGGFVGDKREVTIPGPGTYTVAFETKDGCYEELTLRLEAEDVGCMIPKGISPNGDGLNDYFDLSNYKVRSLKVFNRNGSEAYSHGQGYTIEWMGQDKSGNKLPSGTYYYVIETDQATLTGWVQINY